MTHQLLFCLINKTFFLFRVAEVFCTSIMAVTNMSMKLLIDTENRKVLFAEADKDFIDFLFHILRLPLGTIIPLLKNQGTVGSFGSIYDSIEKLSTTYLQPNVNKETLLKYKIHISLATHCSWNSKQKLIVYSRYDWQLWKHLWYN